MTPYQKSHSFNRCVFAWRTILPNFVPFSDSIWNDGRP